MAINLFSRVVPAIALFSASVMMAQNYQTMPVSSGFTADVIANGIGSSTISTNNDVDGVSYAFVAKDFQLTSSSAAITYGIPVDGIINSVVATTPGLSFQLASLNANNSLRLAAASDNGTLAFTTPKAATKLYMLAVSGSGTSTVSVMVNFTDGSSQTFASISLSDWYNGSNFAIQGIGRIKKPGATPGAGDDVPSPEGGTNPRLYQAELAIDAANQAKLVQSVTVTKVSGSGIPNIFAFSADAYSDCMPPVLQAVSGITANSALVSWTGNAASYDVYHSTSNTTPAGSVTPTYPGVTGTSTTIGGLNSNTTYYYWVRSNCNTATGQSVWSFAGTFKTACSTFTVPYTENFDSTSTGSSSNTNAPSCWAYLESASFTGYGYVTTTNNYSAPNAYYLYNSTATTGSQMLVSPPTVNLSDGTKRVRFYAKSGSNGYTLLVGTLSNPADPASFTPIGSPIALTTTHTQYTVNIPAGSDLQLAFKHGLGGTGRGLYIDNITVQNIPSCLEPTAVTSSNVSANTATIGWTEPSPVPAGGYEVYYSTNNTAPDASTVLNATNSVTSTTASAPLNGLQPSTTYYTWVRSSCSASDKSIWSTSTSFTTLCVPITTLPWSENFDAMATIGSAIIPNCWKQTPGGSSSNYNFTSANASQQAYNDPKSAPNYVTIYYPYSNAAYLWTPTFTLTAGSSYDFTFYWVGDGYSGWQNEVLVNNGQTATGATSLSTFITADQTSEGGGNSTTYTKVTVTYTPTATGDYSFGIKALNTTTAPYYMGFDDFSLTQSNLATAETAVKKKEVNVYPNPFKDILHVADIKNVKSVTVTDVAGRVVKTIDNPTTELQLGELNAGLYLVTMNFKDGSKSTVKAIKK
ncbi:fibronectin type III domain-containing protein [Chryseobacterium viscerum]|uniref:fibronectin type III domain-containing protein n=1 Tax=Chryseobacterium viscerum TaxID=1037377 RepID=UPI0022225182|nr:fibronectin type III domain-containing protein [Chryseobacterium viscerum]MCW1960722.1 T9SS type A sorting domain-containing protein [Chryseobacterium viscerum]